MPNRPTCLFCSAVAPRAYHRLSNDQPVEYSGLGDNPSGRPPSVMANLCHRHLKVLKAAGSKGRVYGPTGSRWWLDELRWG